MFLPSALQPKTHLPTHSAAEVTGVFYDSFDPVFENCIQAGAKAANAVLVSQTTV